MHRLLLAALLLFSTPLLAQTELPVGPMAPSPAAAPVVMATDSGETREELMDLLRRQPPEVGMVLKLDPTLFGNEGYLGSYPALSAFVAQHPEVARSPAYYLENVWIHGDVGPPASPGTRLLQNLMEGTLMFAVFLTVTLSLVWLVKTFVQQRRWSRLSRVQTEVHGKLLDRMSSNQEVLAYVQTTAGRRFLESAPIPVDAAVPSVPSPVARILVAVQIGIIVAAAGLGLQIVGGRVAGEAAQALHGLGIVALCVGGGFVLAGIAGFMLSRQLGLWPPPHSEEESPGRA